MRNDYRQNCARCGLPVVVGDGTLKRKHGGFIVVHDECPIPTVHVTLPPPPRPGQFAADHRILPFAVDIDNKDARA